MSDVYLYGMISPSTVHVLRGDFAFPQANGYAEIAQTLPSIGGEAANSAIVLSKLGLKTKLDGNWITPSGADKVFGMLGAYGIDLTSLSVKPAAGTEEIVIADAATRTVFGKYAGFHTGPRQWNDPRPEDIEQSSMVCLDPYFREQSTEAAELCVKFARPYVTLDCRYDGYVAQNAAAVVISHELRDQAYAGRDHQGVFKEYLERCQGLVIFTFGGEPLWFARPGGSRKIFRPYKIDPVDTTGAGDSFRGAIAYGLLKGWSDEATVEFASAVAACVCLTVPHALNAPGIDEIVAFQERNRRSDRFAQA
jgi:ribokinase